MQTQNDLSLSLSLIPFRKIEYPTKKERVLVDLLAMGIGSVNGT